MQGVAGFDWRTLGKADYSQAAALVASLPETTRSKLDGVSKEILCRITALCWSYAEKSGRGRGYAIPSQRYLARTSGRSERTVRRSITKLRALGLLSWIHRKTSGNSWTSNLYSIGKTFLASLFARKGKKPKQNHQRTFLADNDLKREYKASAPMQRGERLTDFLAKLRAEPKPPLGEATLDSAADDWGQGEVVVDRKVELKRQAVRLLAAETQGEW